MACIQENNEEHNNYHLVITGISRAIFSERSHKNNQTSLGLAVPSSDQLGISYIMLTLSNKAFMAGWGWVGGCGLTKLKVEADLVNIRKLC